MVDDRKLIRAFICIDFPDEVVKEIARIQELVGKKKFIGKMTELENLHLTLKFLGEIDEETLEKVKESLKKVKFKEMELKLGEIGAFSFKGNPRIVWVKIEGRQIWDLQADIDDSLKDLFKLESRFMSHLTLARVKYVKDGKAFEEHVRGISVKDTKFNIDKFYLKSSELKRLGPVYTIIEEYKSK